jgi:hypothetical protein
VGRAERRLPPGRRLQPALAQPERLRLARHADGVRPAPGARDELTPDGDGTVLRFTNTVAQLPDDYRTKTVAGWHWHLDALADVLDGKPDRKLWDVEGWEPIHELYVKQLA